MADWLNGYAKSWQNVTNRAQKPLSKWLQRYRQVNGTNPTIGMGAAVDKPPAPLSAGAAAIQNRTSLPLQPEDHLAERDALRAADIGYANNTANDVWSRQASGARAAGFEPNKSGAAQTYDALHSGTSGNPTGYNAWAIVPPAVSMSIPGGAEAVVRAAAARQERLREGRAGEILSAAPLSERPVSAVDGHGAWQQFKDDAKQDRKDAYSGKMIPAVSVWHGTSDGRTPGKAITDEGKYAAHNAWMAAKNAPARSPAEIKAMVTQNAWENAAARRGRMGIDPGLTPQEAEFQTTANPSWKQAMAAYGVQGAMASPDIQGIIADGRKSREMMKAEANLIEGLNRNNVPLDQQDRIVREYRARNGMGETKPAKVSEPTKPTSDAKPANSYRNDARSIIAQSNPTQLDAFDAAVAAGDHVAVARIARTSGVPATVGDPLLQTITGNWGSSYREPEGFSTPGWMPWNWGSGRRPSAYANP